MSRLCCSEPPKKMLTQARSSVGERHLDVVDVVGSIPSAPTKHKAKVERPSQIVVVL